MSFTNFTRSQAIVGGEYLEIVPNERIRYTDRFDDPNLPGRHRGDGYSEKSSFRRNRNQHRTGKHSGAIPVEACYLGWQNSR